MKIDVGYFCNTCFYAAEENKINYNFPIEKNLKEINEEGYYPYDCIEGHHTFKSLDSAKFEILFDLAVMSLSDGYSKESVSTFSSCLESFYTFIIEIILNNRIDNSEQIEKIKSFLSNNSERTLGAFHSLLLSEMKLSIEPFPRKMTEFRNDVTHKGVIPNFNKAQEYGQMVLGYLSNVLLVFIKNDKEEFRKTRWKVIQSLFKKHSQKDLTRISSGYISKPTIIQLRFLDEKHFKTLSLDDATKMLAKEVRSKYGYY